MGRIEGLEEEKNELKIEAPKDATLVLLELSFTGSQGVHYQLKN